MGIMTITDIVCPFQLLYKLELKVRPLRRLVKVTAYCLKLLRALFGLHGTACAARPACFGSLRGFGRHLAATIRKLSSKDPILALTITSSLTSAFIVAPRGLPRYLYNVIMQDARQCPITSEDELYCGPIQKTVRYLMYLASGWGGKMVYPNLIPGEIPNNPEAPEAQRYMWQGFVDKKGRTQRCSVLHSLSRLEIYWDGQRTRPIKSVVLEDENTEGYKKCKKKGPKKPDSPDKNNTSEWPENFHARSRLQAPTLFLDPASMLDTDVRGGATSPPLNPKFDEFWKKIDSKRGTQDEVCSGSEPEKEVEITSSESAKDVEITSSEHKEHSSETGRESMSKNPCTRSQESPILIISGSSDSESQKRRRPKTNKKKRSSKRARISPAVSHSRRTQCTSRVQHTAPMSSWERQASGESRRPWFTPDINRKTDCHPDPQGRSKPHPPCITVPAPTAPAPPLKPVTPSVLVSVSPATPNIPGLRRWWLEQPPKVSSEARGFRPYNRATSSATEQLMFGAQATTSQHSQFGPEALAPSPYSLSPQTLTAPNYIPGPSATSTQQPGEGFLVPQPFGSSFAPSLLPFPQSQAPLAPQSCLEAPPVSSGIPLTALSPLTSSQMTSPIQPIQSVNAPDQALYAQQLRLAAEGLLSLASIASVPQEAHSHATLQVTQRSEGPTGHPLPIRPTPIRLEDWEQLQQRQTLCVMRPDVPVVAPNPRPWSPGIRLVNAEEQLPQVPASPNSSADTPVSSATRLIPPASIVTTTVEGSTAIVSATTTSG